MAVFVNTHYKERAAIVMIIPKGAFLCAEDYHRDVKKYFKINWDIKFFDYKTNADIPDAILPGYIEQFRASAGWFLGVLDDDEDAEDICVQSDDNRNKLRTYMNAEVLQSLPDLDFKMIVAKYNNKRILPNSDKIKLGKIVIKTILEKDINYECHRREFIYLSNVICQVFPGEVREVYYSKSENGQKSSGKLYDAYANYRRLLSCAGLLKRRTYTAPIKKDSGDDIEMKVSDTHFVLDLDFVKTNIKTTDEFIEKWTNSLSERMKILEDSKITLMEYLQLFPILQMHERYILELCLHDVKALYPKFMGFQEFNNLYESILIKAENIKNAVVQKWVKAAEHCTESTKKALAFMLLPYFFPSIKVKGREKRKSYKPSKLEVQEKFVLYYESMQRADILKMDEKSDNTTFTHPMLIFVGANETLIAYVRFMENSFAFEDPMEAVQSCMCLFLALKIPYPAESCIVWHYVQKYLFGISTAQDINSSSIKAVHQQLMTPN